MLLEFDVLFRSYPVLFLPNAVVLLCLSLRLFCTSIVLGFRSIFRVFSCLISIFIVSFSMPALLPLIFRSRSFFFRVRVDTMLSLCQAPRSGLSTLLSSSRGVSCFCCSFFIIGCLIDDVSLIRTWILWKSFGSSLRNCQYVAESRSENLMSC